MMGQANIDRSPDYKHRVASFYGSELMVHRMHKLFACKSSSPDVHVCHNKIQSRREVVTPFDTEPRVNVLAARPAVPFGLGEEISIKEKNKMEIPNGHKVLFQ